MKYIVAVFSALAILAAVLPVPASARVLAVPVRIQEQNEWCWAGCTQAILWYYGRNVTQTAIAQYGTNGRNIPNYGWGQGWSADGLTWCRGNDLILNNFGSINSTGRTDPLAQHTVTSEINAGRPFIITWQWDSGGGHFIVGRGISGNTFYYMDPWTGVGHRTSTYDWVRRNASHGHTWTQSLQLTTNPPAPVDRLSLQLYASDFTGNGKANVVIFRPSSGLWAVRGVTRVFYGQSGDIPVPADYNGDGTANIAIFRPSSGVWRFRDYFGPGRHGFSYFGQNGDIPVPGDYNNSGRINWAIFRPSTGLWASSCGLRVYYGQAGDIPVPGPYVSRSGLRGKTEIAIFRSGTWRIRGYQPIYFGQAGDIPVPGAYSTSSTEPWKPAIFRPSSGLWAIRGTGNYYFGQSGDIPVPADYNVSPFNWGDKITIFRPSTGMWRIRGYNPFYFGGSADTPATR